LPFVIAEDEFFFFAYLFTCLEKLTCFGPFARELFQLLQYVVD